MFLKSKLTKGKEEKYLAKGELRGSSNPFWRSKSTCLKGIGFNYDYADVEGPAKDLRTGFAIDDKNMRSEPLIEKGDLLVTTGMDGIFPKGLNVAIVSKINALKDGDFAYTIEAKPSVENLNDIEVVLVLPPLGFENSESNTL